MTNAQLFKALQGAEVLFAHHCKDATALVWLEETRSLLAKGRVQQAEPVATVTQQYGFAGDNRRLRVINESLDKQLEGVMAERDDRDDVLARIAGLIDAEFSSAYGFSDLVSDLEERLAAPAERAPAPAGGEKQG